MSSRRRIEPAHDLAHTDLGLERLIFFSDAVMAIAITLLAIDLRVPEVVGLATSPELVARLVDMWPRFLSFIVSFGVVAVYWSSHHRHFGLIQRYDGRLILLNMLFLLCITCMPFIAGFLGLYPYLAISLMVYAGAVALTGFAMGGIWWYASRNHRLVDPNLDGQFIRSRTILAFIGPTMFLVSIPAALISPTLAIAVWCASPLVSVAVLRRLNRKPIRRQATH
ncbi:MAG: TMEM175 family protein [Anaerolineae bacterium]